MTEIHESIDVSAALGAEGNVAIQCFSVYVPNKNRHGREVGNQRKWVLEALELMTEINGGATAMPPVEGAWADENRAVVWENPVVVYSYLRTDEFLRSLPRIREFLHRLGRETEQGEIAFEFDDRFYLIKSFDERDP